MNDTDKVERLQRAAMLASRISAARGILQIAGSLDSEERRILGEAVDSLRELERRIHRQAKGHAFDIRGGVL